MVAAARREAAANLKIKKGLETRAAAEEETVAQLVRQRKASEDAAEQPMCAQDKARYSELIKERASVERRIAGTDREGRGAAQPRKAAAARREANARRSHSTSQGTGSGRNGEPRDLPSDVSVGQAFHTRCRRDHLSLRDAVPPGAALLEAARRHRLRRRLRHQIRAPHSGRVEEKYYNAGYGNRLMIDHGYVRRQVRHHRLQPRQPVHSPGRATGPQGPGDRLRRQHRLLHRLPSAPDGLAQRPAPQPDDLVLTEV